MRYFARIRYVGTHFCGFQVQRNQRTVQGVLGEAAEKLFGCPCGITGCSRTDSGVHAEDFCLTITPEDEGAPLVPPHALPLAIRQYLPNDLSVTYAREAPEGFHPRYDAIGKEYCYRLSYGGLPDPFLAGRAWQIPYRLTEAGLLRMQEAAKDFLGVHDFTSFMCTESDMEDRVRTISDISVTGDLHHVTLSVTGNGFLYNMVRIMTGTLFEIGAGRRDSDSIPRTLAALDRTQAGMTAPPDGLYLHRVLYPKELEEKLFGN